jgi:hypothetical protein
MEEIVREQKTQDAKMKNTENCVPLRKQKSNTTNNIIE